MIELKVREYVDRLFGVRKVRTLFQSFRNKSPIQKWNLFQKVASYLLRYSGLNIFNADFKPTFLSLSLGICVSDMLVSIVYTTYLYRADVFHALEGWTWVGVIFTVSNLPWRQQTKRTITFNMTFFCRLSPLIVYLFAVRMYIDSKAYFVFPVITFTNVYPISIPKFVTKV